MTTYFEHYRTLARAKNISSVDVATRCLFKAFYSKSEDKTTLAQLFLSKAFHPIVKPSKLYGGAMPFQAMKQALSYARFNLKRDTKGFVPEDDKEEFLAFLETVKVPA